MAIAFPRSVPAELKVAGLSFYLDPMIEVTPLRSGRQVSADLGPALWRAKYESPFVTESALGAIRAWYDTLLSAEAFYGYDVLRQYPLAYPAGWPTFDDVPGFDGTCILDAVAENNKEIGLAGLPEAFLLNAGDYLAWDYGTGSRALHRISAVGERDGDGVLAIEVRPHVRTGFVVGATTVMLHRPAAKMIIVPGSYADPVGVDRLAKVSFEAIQTL